MSKNPKLLSPNELEQNNQPSEKVETVDAAEVAAIVDEMRQRHELAQAKLSRKSNCEAEIKKYILATGAADEDAARQSREFVEARRKGVSMVDYLQQLGYLKRLDIKGQHANAITVVQKIAETTERNLQVPDLDTINTSLDRTLTAEHIEAINQMERPLMRLRPLNVSAEELRATLNGHKTMYMDTERPQQNMYINKDFVQDVIIKREDKADQVLFQSGIQWQIEIFEGALKPQLLPGDNPELTLGERQECFEKQHPQGVVGMSIKGYMLFDLSELQPGHVPDDFIQADGTYTLLNREYVKEDGRLAGGYWGDVLRRVYLGGAGVHPLFQRARFRPAVVVNVLT